MTTLVLASGSRARARLLAGAGVTFDTEVAAVDEDVVKASLTAERFPLERIAGTLAELKAVRVSQRRPGALVVGADQLLVFEHEIVSKCASVDEARALLQLLRGRTHVLVTASVLARDGTVIWRHVARAGMTMRAFSDAFLEDYLNRAGAALQECVGCYQLEGLGAQLFDRIEGEYFSILGLPLLPLLSVLREHGVILP